MIITNGDISQFLTEHKVSATQVNEATRTGAVSRAFARLRTVEYPVHEWTTPETTPTLVRTIIAMIAAGVHYSTQFSETDPLSSSYGERLQNRAERLLDNLVDGKLVLEEEYLPEAQEVAGTLVTEPMFTIGRLF